MSADAHLPSADAHLPSADAPFLSADAHLASAGMFQAVCLECFVETMNSSNEKLTLCKICSEKREVGLLNYVKGSFVPFANDSFVLYAFFMLF